MLFHLTTLEQWQIAQAIGSYQPPSLSTEGFIHAATASQVADVAKAFFGGQSDLIVLMIEPEKLQAEVRWEAPVHPAPVANFPGDETSLFPHIYGPINLDAVVKTVEWQFLEGEN